MHQNPKCRTGDVNVAYGADNPAPPLSLPCWSLGHGVAQTLDSAGVCVCVCILLLSQSCVLVDVDGHWTVPIRKKRQKGTGLKMETMPAPPNPGPSAGSGGGVEAMALSGLNHSGGVVSPCTQFHPPNKPEQTSRSALAGQEFRLIIFRGAECLRPTDENLRTCTASSPRLTTPLHTRNPPLIQF